MDNENRKYWDQIKTPPKTALSSIGGGRLKGMSSIDPMWRIMAMTEVFGPCGIGWYYEIVKQWDEAHGTEVSANTQITLFVKIDGEWSKGIPGVGGSMLLAQEKKGPFHSDEAYKMSLTDALSTAFKSLGMAADIYMGKFDGNKYNMTEDLLQEPEGITAVQSDTLNKWASFMDEISNPQNASFIRGNLTVWNKATAREWIAKFTEDFPGTKI